jgi:uncharacterized protein YqjF (DUF2071 family)
MTRLLPVHPVAMATTFRHCFLVNFAVPPDALARLLPSHLVPDVHNGSAFVSVVIAEMHRMRPAVLPPALGVTYNQVVYRAVVRCGQERGVTFLRSDASSRLMVLTGNALTFFRFHRARIMWDLTPECVRFSSSSEKQGGGIEAEYNLSSAAHRLPPTSRFTDLGSAQTFLTELYSAFGAKRRDGRVEVVRIKRSPWSSTVITDHTGSYEAMTSGTLFSAGEAILDSVFFARELSYHWRPLELLRPHRLMNAASGGPSEVAAAAPPRSI